MEQVSVYENNVVFKFNELKYFTKEDIERARKEGAELGKLIRGET